MSHTKERIEKNCLNCNAEVMGKYCHICGQENIEPKQTAWHLVTHFFEDITHFDGKFFNTGWLLISRPGFLSAEYSRGRRANYLGPVRMYIFTSFIFFLIFFSFFKMKENEMSGFTVNGKTLQQINALDSTQFAAFTRLIKQKDKDVVIPMSRDQFKTYYDSTFKNSGINFISDTKASSRAEYDSLLKAGIKKDNWFVRELTYKQFELNKKYGDNPKELLNVVFEGLKHRLPQLLFVSLPLLALLLKLLYVRRKQFYYTDHGIFSIHLYIFIFIALLFIISLGKLNDSLHLGLITFVQSVLSIGIFFYAYKAMRNFYQQRRAKTILKFLILNFLFFIVMMLLFVIFLFFSFFTL